MVPSFEDHLSAAQAGDEDAFVHLFRSVQPVLLRYLTTLGGGLADDVASDTWLEVVRRLDRFEGDEAGFRAWVFTIGRSRLTDALRRTKRVPTPVDAEATFEGLADPTDVMLHVEQVFSTEAALEVIAKLPRDQAEAVMLRHVVGLDVAQSAVVLGKRAGAVRVATHRGLKKLAEVLGPDTTDLTLQPARSSRRRAE